MPTTLYHATTKKWAPKIAKKGLVPLSKDRKDGETYLCMSAKESGATTTGRAASDVVFRVKFSALKANNWSKSGAGKAEWRSTDSIPAAKLYWRRFLGTKEQLEWRKASDFPKNGVT